MSNLKMVPGKTLSNTYKTCLHTDKGNNDKM